MGPGNHFCFSTEELDPKLPETIRRKLWRDFYTSRYGDADIEWEDDSKFKASSQSILIDELVVDRFESFFSRLSRDKRQASSGDCGYIVLGFIKRYKVHVNLYKWGADLFPDDALFYSAESPYEVLSTEGAAGQALLIPLQLFNDQSVPVSSCAGRRLDPANPAVAMLGRYLDLVLSPDTRMPGLLQDHVRRTLVDLAALAIGAKRDLVHLATERGLKDARLTAIKADIQANLGLHELSVSMIARRHGVSPRYVHMLFEAEGQTFTEHVTVERLRAAHRMLTQSSYGHLRISDVAFAVGYIDLSTFNRHFRRVYGGTPSEIRASA